MDMRLARLLAFFRARGAVAVAYSGGADSTLALFAASRALGSRALGVHVRSEFVAAADIRRAGEIAAFLKNAAGTTILSRSLSLLAAPALRANPPERCYLCKREVLAAIGRTAREALGPGAEVCDGTNADDDPARPGRRALAELGVSSPLAACGLEKRDVRDLARSLGLPNADDPSNSCLAARLPAGCALTRKRLSAVEDLENAAREVGLRDLRARILPGEGADGALLLVRPEQLALAREHAEELERQALSLGFAHFDLGERT